MVAKTLKNKPLREAIFELRWKLQEPEPGLKIDPNYRLLIGSLYDKIKTEYPFHEELPTSRMPDEIAAFIVQHRFRKEENGWPLIQIGPGIFTLNDTSGYSWNDFEKRISEGLSAFFGSYPDSEKNLTIENLILRYIDAISFDYQKENAFKFLKEKMKINIELYEKLFKGTGIKEMPLGFDLVMTFKSTKPEGMIHLRFYRGKKDEADELIWETVFQSKGAHVPKSKDQIMKCVNDGHKLTDDWFFKIIAGELQERFE